MTKFHGNNIHDHRYIAPVSFSAEEVADEEKRKAMNDGINVMTRNILTAVEFVVAMRCKQYLEVIEKALKK